jgi:aspartate 1-decarboxylase
MTKLSEKLIELSVITAEQGEDDEAIIAAIQTMREDNIALAESNSALVIENNRFKADAEQAIQATADTVIQAAIAEGKISENDKVTIAFYKDQYRREPDMTKKVLAALYPNPVLQKQITVKAGDSKRLTATAADKAGLQQQQKVVIAEVRAANPLMSYADVFNKARRDHPEVFPPETVEA